jgi:5-formyltetrahydrofolate cyclo-ligase
VKPWKEVGVSRDDLKLHKAALRKSALQRRDALPLIWRQQAAERIVQYYTRTVAVAAGQIIAGFWPIRSEIDPRPLMQELEKKGAHLCLPAVLNATEIEFRAVSFVHYPHYDQGELVETGFGTYGPPAEASVVDPDVILLPLAAFDVYGNRIGYGAGYYDRAIAALHQKNKFPRLIGIAFNTQRVDQIGHEPHDVALNDILTETGLISVRPT